MMNVKVFLSRKRLSRTYSGFLCQGDSGKSKWLLTGFLCLLWAACEEPAGQPAFSDEKITRIMADLYVAEAATTGLSGYQKDSLMHVYFTQTLQMHGLTEEQYEKELRLRAPDVERMERILTEAQRLLEPPEEKGGEPSAE